jgi:hypothetical protein
MTGPCLVEASPLLSAESEFLKACEEDTMRQLSALWLLLLCSGMASGQDTWAPPGDYAQSFAPRIATPSAPPEALITPSLTLDSPAPVVGASSNTVSATGSSVHFNRPVWYEPGVQFTSAFYESSNATAQDDSGPPSRAPRPFELGAATFQSTYGVAQLAGDRVRRKAVRVYTNPDVARLNDTNGTIRYGGKLND